VIAETEQDLSKRLNEWKNNVKNKGTRVNMNKNQGYDEWRTSEAIAKGCKVAVWCMWQRCSSHLKGFLLELSST